MQRYGNAEGHSGVAEYECGPGYIKIRFVHDHHIYVYTDAKPGASHVHNMQYLAEAGRGLATYVSRFVGDNYDHKIG